MALQTIPVRCPCGKRYNADPAHAGRALRCRCGRTVRIPETAGSRRFRLPRLKVPARLVRVLTILCFGYLGAAIAAALFLWVLGDRWWPATVLLFGPRWPLLLPAFPLLLAALAIKPRLLIPTALATLVVLGPVMGFSLGWRRWIAGTGPRELRLISFNVAGGFNPRLTSVPGELVRLEPDVIAFQECHPRLMKPEYWPPEWNLDVHGGICLASRFQIASVTVLERVSTGEQGGTGNAVLYRLRPPNDSIDLAVVHLETPRKGLEPLRYGGEAGSLALNILVREVGSSRISRWIASHSAEPVITGDFNLPLESRIFQEHWSSCPGAFTTAGFGFGWTRVLTRFSVRIDHALACGSWRALRARVGPDLGSDHRPLIVDLARRH